MLKVERVETRAHWKAFQKVPWQVYSGDPHWVPTPGAAERHMLDTTRNSFYQHARLACWIVHRNGELQGRIAAIVDDNHNAAHNELAGHFGFFEVQPNYEAASLLLTTACEWLAQQGLKKLRGPASPSLNHECGTLIDGFGQTPYILMAYNPPYYPEFFDRFGLTKAKDLNAYLLDITKPLPELIHRVSDRARKSGLVLRSLDYSRLTDEINRCRAVFDDAWRENWGFVPMTDAEWNALALEFKPILIRDLIMVAEMNGKPVGLALCLPDINPILQGLRKWTWPLAYLRLGLRWYTPKRVRAALIGVIPGQQSMGIGAALYEELIARGRRLGTESVEISWVLEDNALANRSAQTIGGRHYKTYRLYEMPIGG